MASQIRAVIFDFDGTLADTFNYRLATWKSAFAKQDLTFDEHRLRDLIVEGLDNTTIVNRLFPDLPSEQVEQLIGSKKKLREDYIPLISLFPEAKHVLSMLRAAGLRVAVCTGTSESTVREVLLREVLTVPVTVIVGAESTGKPKPDPESLCRALEILDLLPSEVLFVGDTEIDSKAASNCGIPFHHAIRSSFSQPLALYDVLKFVESTQSNTDRHKNSQDAREEVFKEAEYEALKREILQYQRFRLQIVAFTIAAMVVIGSLPFRFDQKVDSVSVMLVVLLTALTPYMIILPASVFIDLLSRHITQIGAYILTAHEVARDSSGWECSRFELDVTDRTRRISTRISYAMIYSGFACIRSYSVLSLDTMLPLASRQISSST